MNQYTLYIAAAYGVFVVGVGWLSWQFFKANRRCRQLLRGADESSTT